MLAAGVVAEGTSARPVCRLVFLWYGERLPETLLGIRARRGASCKRDARPIALFIYGLITDVTTCSRFPPSDCAATAPPALVVEDMGVGNIPAPFAVPTSTFSQHACWPQANEQVALPVFESQKGPMEQRLLKSRKPAGKFVEPFGAQTMKSRVHCSYAPARCTRWM